MGDQLSNPFGIFGSDDSSSQARQTGTADLYTPEQKALLAKLSQIAQQQIGQGVTTYPLSTVAGAAPLQQQQFQMLQDVMNRSGSGGNALTSLLNPNQYQQQNMLNAAIGAAGNMGAANNQAQTTLASLMNPSNTNYALNRALTAANQATGVNQLAQRAYAGNLNPSNVNRAMGTAQTMANRALGANNMAQNTYSSMMKPYDASGAQQYWQTSMVNPAMQQFKNQVLPALQEKYIAQGAGSSGAFNRALARAGTEASTNMAAKLGDLIYQGQGEHANRQMQAAQNMTAAAQQPFDMSRALLGDTMGMNAQQMQAASGLSQLAQQPFEMNRALTSDMSGLNAQRAQAAQSLSSVAQQPFDATRALFGDTMSLGAQQTAAQQAGLSALPSLAAMLGQAGATQQGIAGQYLQEPYQRWQQAQPYNNPYVSQYGSLALGSKAIEPIVTPGTQSPGLESLAGPALQALMTYWLMG